MLYRQILNLKIKKAWFSGLKKKENDLFILYILFFINVCLYFQVHISLQQLRDMLLLVLEKKQYTSNYTKPYKVFNVK